MSTNPIRFELVSALVLFFVLTTASPTFCSENVPIRINGKPLEFFGPDRTEYRYYLPHDSEVFPDVRCDVENANFIFSDSRETVRIEWKEKDGSRKSYTIRFERLPKLDLFLCIGQSNISGRGYLKSEDREPIPSVYLLTPQGNWEPASNPLNKYSSVRKSIDMQRMSFVYSFAQKIARETGHPIGLVVNARGGTSMNEWSPNNSGKGFKLYREAVRRATEASAWGEFRAVLWHQGGSDRANHQTYPEKLKLFVSQLRKDLKNDRLPFIAGELAHWIKTTPEKPGNEKFNEMIATIGNIIEHAEIVSAAGLKPLNGDSNDPHFDRGSQLIFGERYAEVVLEKVYRLKRP
jgi:hypothetical protein